MENCRKLPAGIQDFEDLRTNGNFYVDKTAYVYRLANFGKQIDKKGYLMPYLASKIYPDGGRKKLMKIGAEFSKTERGLKRWVIEKV